MNAYTFKCPIKDNEGVTVSYCQSVHSLGMTGRQSEIEDPICALAHTCWMCPFRNAVRVGGPWSHYDTMPRSETPNTPANLPTNLKNYALSHRPPYESDYRRCGMRGEEVGQFDELFRSLNEKTRGHPPVRPSRSSPKKSRSKPKSMADAVGQGAESMAEAVTALAQEEKRSQAAHSKPQSEAKREVAKSSAEKRKAPQRAPQRPAEPQKRMSLAERAKLMKAKRSV